MPTLARGCIAEFLGTFALVFFGCGSIVMTDESLASGASLVTVALAHGLILMVFVSACMYVSGAQFNPAVSIALLTLGKQDARTTGAYVATQLLAAACAAGMLVALIGPELANNDVVRLGATIGRFTLEGKTTEVLALEALQTFALMFVILGAVADGRAHKTGGWPVGLVVAACILAFGPLTGSSMNPARTFGPALYGHWEMHWVYWAGPIAGAVVAAWVWKMVWGKAGPGAG